MKTAVLQVSHRWHAGGTIWPLFHLCSTWGRQRSMRWNARNPLSCLKNHGLFHLGHQKTTYPRIRAPQPRCGPVWAFPGRGGNIPRPGNRDDVVAVAGKAEHLVPVILNEVKNLFSPLQADRNGIWRTDPSTPLRSAQDDNNERLVRKSHRALAKDGFANPPVFTRPRRGKQSRRLSTACRRVPGRSPDPLLLTKRREEMKCNSLTSQKFYHRKEIQFV